MDTFTTGYINVLFIQLFLHVYPFNIIFYHEAPIDILNSESNLLGFKYNIIKIVISGNWSLVVNIILFNGTSTYIFYT